MRRLQTVPEKKPARTQYHQPDRPVVKLPPFPPCSALHQISRGKSTAFPVAQNCSAWHQRSGNTSSRTPRPLKSSLLNARSENSETSATCIRETISAKSCHRVMPQESKVAVAHFPNRSDASLCRATTNCLLGIFISASFSSFFVAGARFPNPAPCSELHSAKALCIASKANS